MPQKVRFRNLPRQIDVHEIKVTEYEMTANTGDSSCLQQDCGGERAPARPDALRVLQWDLLRSVLGAVYIEAWSSAVCNSQFITAIRTFLPKTLW